MFFIRPLQKNGFYIVHSLMIIGAAYYIETHYFRASLFSYKTLLLFLVFQIISINIVTFFAYGLDKRAAVRKTWRVPEQTLHILEFLGGWAGALLAMKIFRHKTKKAAFQKTFWLLFGFEVILVVGALKFIFNQ